MNTTTITSEWISRTHAAELLGISTRTFDRLRTVAGFPTARRFGTAIRYSIDELREWASAQVAHPLVIAEPARSAIPVGVARGPQRRRAA